MTTIPWILNIYVLKYRNFKDDKDTTMLSVIGVNGKVADRIHLSREINSRIVKHFPYYATFHVFYFSRVFRKAVLLVNYRLRYEHVLRSDSRR